MGKLPQLAIETDPSVFLLLRRALDSHVSLVLSSLAALRVPRRGHHDIVDITSRIGGKKCAQSLHFVMSHLTLISAFCRRIIMRKFSLIDLECRTKIIKNSTFLLVIYFALKIYNS